MDNPPNLENSAPNIIARAEKYLDDSIERNLDRGSRTSAQLDGTLISLSAGALVLSMTFIRNVAPAKCLLVVLFASWICFLLVLSLIICAMRSEQKALENAVKNASDARDVLKKNQSINVVFTKMGIPLTEKRVNANRKVAILNYWAFIAFICGVILMGVFVGYTLWNTHESKGEQAKAETHSPSPQAPHKFTQRIDGAREPSRN